VFADDWPKGHDHLRFRLGPDVVIALGARTKTPGEAMIGEQIELEVLHGAGDEMSAYERLIGDAMTGEATLFARQDSAEAQWRIVDPVLGDKAPVHEYERGTWGPEEAAGIARSFGGWHDPLVVSGTPERNERDMPIRKIS
jgi:glucose-6-phosphate 1-dehydrogenase